jgi:hypothetical protein
VLDSLRDKTGFAEMRFDETGFLTLGDRSRITGGSATARELILAVVEGRQIIELENHHRSPHVAFAQLGTTIHLQSRLVESQLKPAGTPVEVRVLRLDFYDFEQLRGGKQARAAFDIGLAVLHELAHAVLHLRDDEANEDGPGEAVKYINRIHHELGLPERQSYYPRVYRKARSDNSLISELWFAYPANSKQVRLWWETSKVGTYSHP